MANSKVRKLLAFGTAALMSVSVLLSGCGGSGSSDSSGKDAADSADSSDVQSADADTDAADSTADSGETETFSWTISMPETDSGFDSWNDSPAVQEWLADCGENIAIDFNEAPISADSDFYNTLLATGEYTDVFSPTLSSSTAVQLYEEGIAMDLTELVEENMPNYMAWVEEHPIYHSQIYKNVNGEDKIIALYQLNEASVPWSALLYRRDWILEYGEDEDGNAFEGGWNDDKTEWTDNIVFPSGETYPKYISDWEWMLQIFEDALEALNVDDGAVMTIKYNGYYGGQAPIQCGFGQSYPNWDVSPEGELRYGWTDNSEASRAYVECMAHWYEEGWIDRSFDERTGDSVFFMVNQEAVYSGKVGVQYGLIESMTGNALGKDREGDPLLENICYMGAPQPINDVYGDASVQNVDPWHYFEAGSLLGGENVITVKAENKDVAKLLRAIDYLYGPEGEALSMMGVSGEQQAEHQYQVMIDFGLENGAYSKSGDTYVIDPVVTEKSLGAAVSLNRLGVGFNPNAHIDYGYNEIQQEAVELAALYPGGGSIEDLVLPSDQADEATQISNAVGTILDVSVPDFITGRVALNDDTWQDLQDQLQEQGVDRITEYYKALQ